MLKQKHSFGTSTNNTKMSPPMMSASNSAMIIFDWDDTILPSSFVDRAQGDNLSELPEQYTSIFREIEICTVKCFKAAAKHGEVRCDCVYDMIPIASDSPPLNSIYLFFSFINTHLFVLFLHAGSNNHQL